MFFINSFAIHCSYYGQCGPGFSVLSTFPISCLPLLSLLLLARLCGGIVRIIAQLHCCCLF